MKSNDLELNRLRSNVACCLLDLRKASRFGEPANAYEWLFRDIAKDSALHRLMKVRSELYVYLTEKEL